MRRVITALLVVGLLSPYIFLFGLASPNYAAAQDQRPPESNTLSQGQIQRFPPLLSTEALSTALISRTDEDWSGFSTCSDCSEGWSDDTWELTLTRERTVTFMIEDCCIVGDYYELWIDGRNVGTTQRVNLFGPDLSMGTFEVTLRGGTHQIRVRDAALQNFSPDVLTFMCPAGFFLSWTLGEAPNPWWRGALGALTGVAKQLGESTAEFIAGIKGLGPAWDGLVGGWKIYKAKEVGDNFENPDYRARLIDEAYNNYGGRNVKFRTNVDQGVGLGCALIGCTATSWNDLTFEQKRNEDIWLSVCASVGGGYCSGYLLPAFMSKWLE